ncbi:MAG: DUF58 domain-containing protein [Pseudomonadota bacterium]
MRAMPYHAWVLRWVSRRHPPVTGPITVDRRRIYILPTRQGWGFALLLGTMLLAALNYGNSLMFVVCFWMGGVAFLTMHHTHRNLLGLRITGQPAAPVFAGSEAVFGLQLSHTGTFPRYGLRLHHADQTRALAPLPADVETAVPVAVPAPQRGRLDLPRLGLSTTYPLGLFEAWTWIHPKLETLVYPCPAPHAPPPVGAGLRSGIGTAGDHGEGSEDYRGLRSYRSGDGAHTIAWRVLARERGLVVKQFSEANRPEWRLDWAQFAHEADAERILSLLCRQALDAHAHGAPFALSLPDRQVPLGSDEDHLQKLLRALALYGLPARETP